MQYEWSNNVFVANYSAMNPQEKLLLGMVTKPSKRLSFFTQFGMDLRDKTESLVGFRAKFSEGGQVTGILTSNGKAVSSYRKFMDMFELNFVGTLDVKKP